MSAKAKYRRRLITRLWFRQQGACHYCGVLMRQGPWDPKFPIPDNACTLEHTIPKGHPLRGVKQKCVAACNKCNRDKNHEFLCAQTRPRVEGERLVYLEGAGHLQLNQNGTFLWNISQLGEAAFELGGRDIKHFTVPIRVHHNQGVHLAASSKTVHRGNGRGFLRRARRKRKNQGQEQIPHSPTLPPPLRWT